MKIADERTEAAVENSATTGSRRRRKVDHVVMARRRMLAAIPALTHLQPALLDELASGTRAFTLLPRAELFRAGDQPLGIYAVVVGRMELLLDTAAEAKVLALLEPGTIFGVGALLLDQPPLFTARALEPATLLFFPRTLMRAALTRSPQFNQRLMVVLSQHLNRLIDDIAGYTQRNAGQRLARYLLDLPAGVGQRVHLPVHKRVLASHLSIAPATLSRMLSRLRDDGVVTIAGRTITILDRAALESMRD